MIPKTPFGALDEQPPEFAALLVAALEMMAASPEIQRVRQVARDALAPVPGQRLLDAGCGAGEVARDLAARVAPGGSVVALDYARTNVEAAAQRHDGSAVEYVVGNVTALDFPDATFDGVRSERVLQHVDDPDRAIAELARVTKPGGRVCLIDTDWDSVGADGVPRELFVRLRDHAFSRVMVHHRDMGRTLRRRMLHAGLAEIRAQPVALYFGDPESAMAVLPMVSRLVPPQAGFIPDDMRDEWFAAVDAAGERGDFLATLTLWVVSGVRL